MLFIPESGSFRVECPVTQIIPVANSFQDDPTNCGGRDKNTA